MEETQTQEIHTQANERSLLWLRSFFILLTAAYAFLFIRQPSLAISL